MRIRTLNARDAAAYRELRYEALASEPRAFGTDAEEFRAKPTVAVTKRLEEAQEDDFTLGAFDSGALIALASFTRETGVKERHKGSITGVYVTAAYRRRGIAKKMMAELLARAILDPSLECLLLSVSVSQTAAVELYRQLGFQIYGTQPRALKIGTEYVDESQMVLNLR